MENRKFPKHRKEGTVESNSVSKYNYMSLKISLRFRKKVISSQFSKGLFSTIMKDLVFVEIKIKLCFHGYLRDNSVCMRIVVKYVFTVSQDAQIFL